MKLANRIHAVMDGWADAGDDVPEELKIIREQREQIHTLLDICKRAQIDYRGMAHTFQNYGFNASAMEAMETADYIKATLVTVEVA